MIAPAAISPDRPALHDHVGLAAGQEEGRGGDRALVEEAVAGQQLAEAGHRADAGVVGDREVPEEVVGLHPAPAGPCRRLVPGDQIHRHATTSFPAPRSIFQLERST